MRKLLPIFSLLLFGCAAQSVSIQHETTVKEYLEQTSQALLRPGTGENWKPDTAKAREIQRRKAELAALVEDANWVLVLDWALSGPLPDDTKQMLRGLHESYAARSPHEQIANQVEELLPKIQDDRLRRELKKLANRSWDRDVRAHGHAPAQTLQASLQLSPIVRADGNPPLQTTVPDSLTLDQSKNRVDTLISHGHYLEALRRLETIEDKAGTDWTKGRRKNLGDRYCEERRSAAAGAFATARRTKTNSLRLQYLKQSKAELDSCLYEFPDAAVSEKARRNRELVEKELNGL